MNIDMKEKDIMGNGKFDPSRLKEKKHKDKKIVVEFDDAEMLRIQGLRRCLSCETPYPLNFEKCPMCKESV